MKKSILSLCILFFSFSLVGYEANAQTLFSSPKIVAMPNAIEVAIDEDYSTNRHVPILNKKVSEKKYTYGNYSTLDYILLIAAGFAVIIVTLFFFERIAKRKRS